MSEESNESDLLDINEPDSEPDSDPKPNVKKRRICGSLTKGKNTESY